MTFDQWLDTPISGTTRRAYYSDNQLTAARDAWAAATTNPDMRHLGQRAAFEAAISAPPFARNVARWPDNMHNCWPGGYKDIEVACAWCMWQEATRQEREVCAQECDALASVEGIAQRCAAAIRSRGEK